MSESQWPPGFGPPEYDAAPVLVSPINWLRKFAYFPCSVCAIHPVNDVYACHRAAGLRLYLDGRICEQCCLRLDVDFQGLPLFDPFVGLTDQPGVEIAEKKPRKERREYDG